MTKKEVLKNHKKMWLWISKQYMKGRTEGVTTLKEEYLAKHEISVYNNCFCCEYARDKRYACGEGKDMCLYCPVIWRTEEYCSFEQIETCCETKGSDYEKLCRLKISDISDCEYASFLAFCIAHCSKKREKKEEYKKDESSRCTESY